MPLTDCTCVHMLFHMNMCYRKGGAECSRSGKTVGRSRKADWPAKRDVLDAFEDALLSIEIISADYKLHTIRF